MVVCIHNEEIAHWAARRCLVWLGCAALMVFLLRCSLLPACGQAAVPGAGTGAGIESAKTLTAAARRRMEAADFRASGRLVQVAANGARTISNFSLKAHWFPDGLRLLFEITAPAAARQRVLLTLSPHGQLAVEAARPGDKAPRVVPFERWPGTLQDTLFSYEDLVEIQFFWPLQTLLPDARYGARDCHVLRSEPTAAQHSHYSSVITWIDRQSGAPVHTEKTLAASGQVKQFQAYGLRHTGGVWSASQVQVKAQGSSASSLLIVERGSADARLNRGDFDAAAMTRP